jgi:hypothetical protein
VIFSAIKEYPPDASIGSKAEPLNLVLNEPIEITSPD